MSRMLHGSARFAWLVVIAASLAACATVDIPAPGTVLSEDQTIDLIERPRRWHGREVTVRIYPYDLGFGRSNAGWSYAVCFERCDRAVADRSVFILHSGLDRYKGYAGDRAVVVHARYEACNVDWVCADLWAGAFTEIERLAG